MTTKPQFFSPIVDRVCKTCGVLQPASRYGMIRVEKPKKIFYYQRKDCKFCCSDAGKKYYHDKKSQNATLQTGKPTRVQTANRSRVFEMRGVATGTSIHIPIESQPK